MSKVGWFGSEPEDHQRREDRKKLRGWIHVVREDVATIIANREMFKRVIAIWQANPRLGHARSSFLDWIFRLYAPAICVGIRRQVDSSDRDGARSFFRFLSAVKKQPELFTREWIYLSLSEQPEDWAKQHIDELIGVGAEHLPRSALERDQTELKEVAAKVRAFVDKRVAHRDPEPIDAAALPTFADVDCAVDVLEKLLRKYMRIIGEPVPESFVPSPQWPNDDLAFRIPWMEDAKE